MDGAATARLTVELVPRTCWLSNVRTLVSRLEWDTVRKLVYVQAGYQCEVCGGRGDAHPVECHEQWLYDEAQRVQRLAKMVALCPACHEVKHIGFADLRDRGGEAFAHLLRVNGWTPQQTFEYLQLVWRRWERRSRVRWSLDVSALGVYGIAPRDDHDGSYVYRPGGLTGRVSGGEFQGREPGPRPDYAQLIRERAERARRFG